MGWVPDDGIRFYSGVDRVKCECGGILEDTGHRWFRLVIVSCRSCAERTGLSRSVFGAE